MNNYRRLIPGGGWLRRRLCTAATEAEPMTKKVVLYRRLSGLEMTGGSVSETLNQYVTEGHAIKKSELRRCVEQLRKYRKFKHALEIMDWLEMRKISFTYDDYAIYLDLVSKTKGVVAAENYFSGLPPKAKNKFTYGALLNCYCKELQIEKALAHFEKMDEMKYVTNLAFNNLMTLYMKLGRPEKVPPLVEDLKQRKLDMADFTYHIWMNSLASLNDLDGVERVYEEMKTVEKNKVGWHTYNNLASIYVKAKQFEKAESMLKMLEKEVKPSPSHRDAYHFMLSLYAGTSNLEELHRVWNSLKSITPVTNTSYLTFLRALRKANDMEGITKCFKEWESSCVIYDIRLANICIGAYLRQNRYEEASSVFKDAMQRSKGPFFKIRDLFMIFFLEKGQLDDALSHLEAVLPEIKNDKQCLSPQVISAFLKYYEEKDLDGVEELCKILKIDGSNDSSLRTYIAESKSSPEDHQTVKDNS